MGHILIIEDDAAIRSLLVDILEYEGFVCSAAGDGRTGVLVTRSAQPDLILMDLMLPVMTGLDAIHTLRTTPETSHIPIIATSALSSLLRIAQQDGADEVLPKPFELTVLLEIVERLLAESRAVHCEDLR